MADTKNEEIETEPQKEEIEVEEDVPALAINKIGGTNPMKLHNYQIIKENTFVYHSGMKFSILNTVTKHEKIFLSQDGGGIGCIRVHPSKKYIAVGEKGRFPSIYIYSYPSMEVYKKLERGTERSYMCLNFSKSGDKLASVGYEPDYSLVIWDWEKEVIILKAKAFSQEIYSVDFSDYRGDFLCTSGLAHLKFWKIAKTFTGLKLKGNLGKFGQIELSDITTFAIMPDEKVVSGSESGNLLLWEGYFIKAVIMKSEGVNCHMGTIDVVKIMDDKTLITAGEDNYVRIWDLEKIDMMESDEDSIAYLQPLKEIYIGENIHIVNLHLDLVSQGQIIVQNVNGSIIRLFSTCKDFIREDVEIEPMFDFVPGKIVATATLNNKMLSAYSSAYIVEHDSLNEFNRVKVDDYKLTTMIITKGYIVTGNVKGILQIYDKEYTKKGHCKVFTNPIKFLMSYEEFLICVNDSEAFVLKLNDDNTFEPEYLVRSEKQAITSCMVANKKLYLGYNSGYVESYDIKSIPQEMKIKNYEIPKAELGLKTGRLRMMEFQKPKQDENDIDFMLADNVETIEVEWSPGKINTLCEYHSCVFGEQVIDQSEDLVWVSSESEFIGYTYLIRLYSDFNDADMIRPEASVKIKDNLLCFEKKTDNEYLLGYTNGIVEKRNLLTPEKAIWRSQGHDPDFGQIIDFKFDSIENRYFSISKDNTLVYYDEEAIDTGFENQIKMESELKVQPISEEEVKGYSLQEEKIQAVKDRKKKEAEDYKKVMKGKIVDLREKYSKLLKSNTDLPSHYQVELDKLTFDPKFDEYIEKNIREAVDEATKDVEYSKKLSDLKISKIKKYYIENLSDISFGVSKLTKNQVVFSFKLRKLNSYIKREMEKINKEIENEAEDEEQADLTNKTKNSKRLVKTKELISMLHKLKKKQQENRHIDYYQKIKAEVKEECRVYNSIDELRKYKDDVNKELKALKIQEPLINSAKNNREIEEVKRNFGNYMLKSSDDYIVDDENRISVGNLETHILLIEKFIYNSSKTFNNTLKDLRKEKNELIKEIKDANSSLKNISEQLGVEFKPFTYIRNSSVEDPESIMKVGREDVNDYYQKKLTQSFKQNSGMMEQEVVVKQSIAEIDTSKSHGENLNDQFITSLTNPGRKRNGKIELKNKKVKKIIEIKLNSEKHRLISTITKKIQDFDQKIQWTIDERAKLEKELKMAEMRTYELFRQLLEVEIYEEQDQGLLRELFSQRDTLKIWNSKKLTNTCKLKDIETKEQEQMTEFIKTKNEYDEKIFPNHKEKSEFVFNYFKQIYKNSNSNNNQNSNANTFEFNDTSNVLDGEKKEWILMIEQNEEWSELIKKRLQYENELQTIKDEKETLDSECNKIEENIIDLQQEMEILKQKINKLQLKKLKKINKLTNAYILSLDQIYLEIPLTNIDDFVLFTNEQLNCLKKRITELKKDCDDIESEKVQLSYSREALNKELVILKNCRKKAKEQLKENFQLKFGDVIDLKILDSMKQSKRLKELKAEYKELNIKSVKQIEETEENITKTKKDLYELKKKNTEIIKKITNLGTTQLKLNKTLDSTNKHIFKNTESNNKENVLKYRKDLVAIVKLLNSELDELKKEVIVLKNKGVSF